MRKFFANILEGKFSLKTKMYLSLSAIAVVLLISSIISVMEYESMSSYVTDKVADNIHSIDVARKLADQMNDYNLGILAVVGDESSVKLPNFDQEAFATRYDSLRTSLSNKTLRHLADSVEYSYAAYMLTSFEMEDVISSAFIDSRSWYFERLQPRYNRLRSDIDKLGEAIYADLSANSETFQSAFYRSIIPGIVAVAVGLLLLLLLLFFIQEYYVKPIYKMLDQLRAYRNYNTSYKYDFDGDDQLSELNDSIKEITAENNTLRKRISAMRQGQSKQ